jgi:hypothetical protein
MKYRKITGKIKQRLVASEGIPNRHSEASSYRGIPWGSSIFNTFTAFH